MKRLFVLSTIIVASLIANSAYSQVFVNAHVGIGLPRIHSLPIPVPVPVIYQSTPVCQEAYAPAPVAYEAYPDAAYYTYPAWNGHYRDHIYYEHYRPYYERSHRVAYNDHRGYDHRDYDHRGDHRRSW
jgi:hypothetical protein